MKYKHLGPKKWLESIPNQVFCGRILMGRDDQVYQPLWRSKDGNPMGTVQFFTITPCLVANEPTWHGCVWKWRDYCPNLWQVSRKIWENRIIQHQNWGSPSLFSHAQVRGTSGHNPTACQNIGWESRLWIWCPRLPRHALWACDLRRVFKATCFLDVFSANKWKKDVPFLLAFGGAG